MASFITDRKHEAGSALTEFAVAAPIYIVILLAILFLGRLGLTKERIAMTARYGAWKMRTHSLNGPPEEQKDIHLDPIHTGLPFLLDPDLLPEISRHDDEGTTLAILRSLADGVNNTVGARATSLLELPGCLREDTKNADGTSTEPLNSVRLDASCFVDGSTWRLSDAFGFVADAFSVEKEFEYARSGASRIDAAAISFGEPVRLALGAFNVTIHLDPMHGSTGSCNQEPYPGSSSPVSFAASGPAGISNISFSESLDAPAIVAESYRKQAARRNRHAQVFGGESSKTLIVEDGDDMTFVAADREPGEHKTTIVTITTGAKKGALEK